MPTTQETLEALLTEFAHALEPLATELQADRVIGFLRELGLQLPQSIGNNAPLVQALGQVGGTAAQLPTLVNDLVAAVEADDNTAKVAAAVALAGLLVRLIQDLQDLEAEFSTATIAGITPADLQAFAADLARKVFDYLLVEYVEHYHQSLFAVSSFMGIIEKTKVDGDPAVAYKPTYYHRAVHFNLLPRWLQPSGALFADLYDWNTPAFDGAKLILGLHRLLYGISVPSTIQDPISDDIGPALLFGPFRMRAGPGFNPHGLDIIARAAISDIATITVPLWGDTIKLQLVVEGGLQASTGLRVLPPATVEVIPPTGTVSGALGIGLIGRKDSGDPIGLLNGFGLSWTAQELGIRARTELGWDVASRTATGNYSIKGYLEDCVVSFDTSAADGFLASVLPLDGFKTEFSLAFGYSSDSGFFLEGSGTIELYLPLHLAIGPAEVQDILVRIAPKDGVIPVEASATISCVIGPLAGVVEGIGLIGTFSTPSAGGNLGRLDLQLGFKPPNGIGLSLDAGAVSGGGYLYFAPERGEYAGIAQLSVLGLLTVTAIGIITTKMPDGSDGFSLLLIMSVEFNPGIQLGYGFTLIGLGGIIGLNRTMVLEALAQGAKNGTINAIMFPQGEIIPQAPRIISDLRTIFPPEEGKFLIGPMVKLGWGTPTLISVSMGVIIEIQGDQAIVGVLRCALPTMETPLVNLQVAFVGGLSLDKGYLFFYAVLYESYLLTFALDGQMGLLLSWGNDPQFVISVGGFHPRFDPPPLPFPDPERLSLSILNETNAKIRVEAYFAVTSNTVQVGASAELYFGLSDCKVEGHIAFDALFQFSPFYFIIEVRASLHVDVFGFDLVTIRVSVTLEGPTPWHAHGTGSISFLLWDFEVEFDKRWGDEADTVLPPVALLPLMNAELDKTGNWSAVLPPSNNLLVSLRNREQASDDLVVHPLGTLTFSQRLLPLQLELDKFGTQAPSDAERFELLPGGTLVKKADAEERFAMAQFVDMSDEKKLSSPSFELAVSGLSIGPNNDLSASRAACRTIRYEEWWIDDEFRDHEKWGKGFDRGLFAHFVGGATVANSVLSGSRKAQLQPFADVIQVKGARYALADADTNGPHTVGGIYRSQAEASQALSRAIVSDPGLHGRLVVIPENELLN